MQDNLHEFMGMLLKKAQRHADSAPFLQPVSAADVPDYYTIIIVSHPVPLRFAFGCPLPAEQPHARKELTARKLLWRPR